MPRWSLWKSCSAWAAPRCPRKCPFEGDDANERRECATRVRVQRSPRSDGARRITMDLKSRLRSIVGGSPAPSGPRELTYEPDTGRYEASIDLDRVADVLGGRVVANTYGRALI